MEQPEWVQRIPSSSQVLILALGESLSKDGTRLSPSSIAVVQRAVRVYTDSSPEQRACLVFVGAGYKPEQVRSLGGYEAKLMREMALAMGVPEGALLYEEPLSDTTPKNAVNTAPAVCGHEWDQVILIADPLHMFRAIWTFRLVWRILGIRQRITPMRSARPEYGDSNKWFMRKASMFRLHNFLGMLLTLCICFRLLVATRFRREAQSSNAPV